MSPNLLRLQRRILLLLAILVVGAGAYPVEVAHPVAPFLRRLEEKGVISPGFWSTLPRDSREVAEKLREAEGKQAFLSAWDRRRLSGFLGEFDVRRRESATRLRYRDSSFVVLGKAEYFTGIYGRDSIPRADVYAFGSFTPGLELTYKSWGYLVASGTIGMERSLHARHEKENFLPQNGLPFNIDRQGVRNYSGKVSTFDGFRMMVGVSTEDLQLEGGQDWNQWGPGQWQHATLGSRPYFWVSDSLPASPDPGFEGTQTPGSYRRGYRYPGEGPPLPQMRLSFKSRRWEYVKIVAQRTGLWKDSAALLVAHRLQVRFGNWRFGATEMLTVGSRDPGWLVLLPGVPLKVIEHEGGNRDNTAMSVDLEWILRGHGRLYGEFFLDDFSGTPLDYWGNKFAWTVGGSWQDPFGLASEFHMEYSRVDPWVYGHHLRGTQMQNYGALLGSALPPNSHALRGSLVLPLPLDLEAGLEGLFQQRDYLSAGGSIFEVYSSSQHSYYKQFLARNVETRYEGQATIAWNWRRYSALRGGAGWTYVERWKGDPEKSLSSPLFFGEITLRY